MATVSVPIVDVALGFQPHTGWTVAVVVGGDVASPQVVDRRVFPLTDEDHVPAQIYHAAVGLELAAAEKMIRRAEEIVTHVTEREVASFLAALRKIGHTADCRNCHDREVDGIRARASGRRSACRCPVRPRRAHAHACGRG